MCFCMGEKQSNHVDDSKVGKYKIQKKGNEEVLTMFFPKLKNINNSDAAGNSKDLQYYLR